MQKFLRSLLIIVLCGLSLLSSSGASEALHENLHALMSSACSETTARNDQAAAEESASASQGLALHAVTAVCPLQLILQAALGQSLILPSPVLAPAALPLDSDFALVPLSTDFVSWNIGWTFSRGPPAIA